MNVRTILESIFLNNFLRYDILLFIFLILFDYCFLKNPHLFRFLIIVINKENINRLSRIFNN